MSGDALEPENAPVSFPGYGRRAGERYGDYVLEKPLGKGGFSEVWLGRHFEDIIENGYGARNRVVYAAVKILVHEEHIAQLRTEADALATIRDPGVCQTYEANLRHDPPYLLLELLGQDLRARLRASDGKYPPAHALSLVERLLEILTRVHREGIVHGDLKPENVLFDTNGINPKLADFGLSRRILQKTGTLSVSLSGADERIAGTIDYMAPEQRAGEKPTLRSDVFAMGVILHELIFGARPQGLEKKATERDPRLPPLVDRILEHALALDPRDRYESAGALLKALRFELWNDARALESIQRGLRERIVLSYAWTVLWAPVAVGSWLAVLAGPSFGHEHILGRFDADLVAGAVGATSPLLLVQPLAKRWRRTLVRTQERIAVQLETLESWRLVSPEALPDAATSTVEVKAPRPSGKRSDVALKLAVGVAALVLLGLASMLAFWRDRGTRALTGPTVGATPRAGASGELPDLHEREALDAFVRLAGQTYGWSDDVDHAREAFEDYASWPEPKSGALRDQARMLVEDPGRSVDVHFLGAYVLEELEQPTFPEPADFCPRGRVVSATKRIPVEEVVRSVQIHTEYTLDAGEFAHAHVQLASDRSPWQALISVAHHMSARLVVEPKKVTFVERTLWDSKGARDPCAGLAGKLGRTLALASGVSLEKVPRPKVGRFDPIRAIRAIARINGCEVREKDAATLEVVAPR